MTDDERLDMAIDRLKAQMAKDRMSNSQMVKDDWKKAYLHKIDLHKQSLNRTMSHA